MLTSRGSFLKKALKTTEKSKFFLVFGGRSWDENRANIDRKIGSKTGCIFLRSKNAPRSHQDAPGRPQDAPRRSQDAPKTPPRRSKTAPRRAQDATKTPQRHPRTPPRCPQNGPRLWYTNMFKLRRNPILGTQNFLT